MKKIINEKTDDRTEIEFVVERLIKIGNYQWCRNFFVQLKICTQQSGLDINDDRLILTMPDQKNEITAHLNNRYIFKIYSGKKLALMLPLEFKDQLKKYSNLDQYEHFTDQNSTHQALWARFNCNTESQLDDFLWSHWHKAVQNETTRKFNSPYRKFDNTILHRMLADDDYLEYVLTLAFETVDIPLAEEISNAEELLHEGMKKTIIINAYERNPKTRSRCLAHYGTQCFVCGFDFGVFYGTLGEGFIHVHHLKPLSQIGETYTVNPVEDLRPVCPNCHSMLHLNTKQVLSIEELKNMIYHPPRKK